MEDEVLVEPEDDLTEEQLQEGTGNEGDSEGSKRSSFSPLYLKKNVW